MSEFLMVVPEGWTEIPDHAAYTAESWLGASLDEAREWLRDLGYTDLLPDGMTVGDKRFFTDGDTARLWVRVVPEA